MAGKGQKKSTGKAKVKVGKLQVNKETVKDLTTQEEKKVKGGMRLTGLCRTNQSCKAC